MGQIGTFPPVFGRSVDAVENSPADTFGKRYGEVLLVSQTPTGPQVAVFNTFPLNDCPPDAWSALDPQTLAAENGVAAALLLSLIHISEPTRQCCTSRMPSSA